MEHRRVAWLKVSTVWLLSLVHVNGWGHLVARRSFLVDSGLLVAVSQQSPADASPRIEALRPIVQLRRSLGDLEVGLKEGQNVGLILDTLPKTEGAFKAVFDAYSDPVSYQQKFLDQNAFLVYYTRGFDGPGRTPLEADPSLVRQTVQFGTRNDAWVAFDDFLVERNFQQQNPNDAAVEDLLLPLRKAQKAIDMYLAEAPKEDLIGASR